MNWNFFRKNIREQNFSSLHRVEFESRRARFSELLDAFDFPNPTSAISSNRYLVFLTESCFFLPRGNITVGKRNL